MPRPALVLLLLVLPLSLGLRASQPGRPQLDGDRLTGDALSQLRAAGWKARALRYRVLGPVIDAVRGDCRILVHFAAPDGATIAKFRDVGERVGPVSFQFREWSGPQLPRVAPLLAWHLQRYAWNVGQSIAVAPLVATARSPGCGSDMPDLASLKQHLKLERPR